jgi:hypothetical protein
MHKKLPITTEEKIILDKGLAPLPVKQIGAERVAGYVLGIFREREKCRKHAFVLVPSTPWGIGLSLAACALLLTGLFGIQTGIIKYKGLNAKMTLSNIGSGINDKSVEEQARIDTAIRILDSTKARLSILAETYRDSSSESANDEVSALMKTLDSCMTILSDK